ncbi:MAG: hypothetical protein SWK90_01710 [Chloroflexota bacterium]|nr:hypothetical protein [Chloroflexota bacterium]
MKHYRKGIIQVLTVSLIGLVSMVGVWLLLSQGASADASITVEKTADPTSLTVPGGPVTFTVRVNNTGTETVTLTSLSDNLYGNMDSKGTCAVTQTILAGEYYECSFTENISSETTTEVTDTVTAGAEDGEGSPLTASDDATVTITAGPLDYIVIEDEAGGAGDPVDTHTMTTDDALTVYAAGYDEFDNYIADQEVDWATTGTLDSQTGSGSSFTFTPSTAGTSGTITADHTTATDDATGTITVGVGDLDHIVICTDANGQSPANSHTMTTDDTWTLYAAGYDADNNFIANQTATWDETGTLDDVSGSSTSYTFEPETAGTSGTITADAGGGMTDATGTITVGVGDLDHIVICTDANGQSPASSHTMTTDDTWTLYAAGYDADNNFIANQTATWDETGTLDNVSGSSTSYTFEPETAGTSGTITADAGGGMTDATGTITVNAGALDYIVICTDANGQSPAGSHTMTTDDTWMLYAAGYDAEDNFRGNETATWDETGTLDDVSGSGTSYTFEPETAGTSGRITANASGKTDETGTITVNVGVLDYIVIEDAAGGTGSEVNTHSLVIGGTFQVWAAGYDEAHNYRGDVTVTWTGTGVVAGRLAPVSGSSTTFTAEEAGTGTIQADDGSGHTDETGTITVQTPVLTITKTDDPDPVNAGATLAYTIIITNSGDAEATTVVVTEHYDANVSFVYANPAPDASSGNRVWTFATLAASDSQTIDIVVQVASPLPVGTTLTNQATLDSDQTTPVTITELTSVTTASALTVSKIDVPDPVPAGGNLTYIISYQNGGTAPAEDVVITEMYDRQVTFVSANPAPRSGTDNVWDIGDLSVGENGSIQVTVRVDTPLPDGATLTNQVTIDSAHTSPQAYVETTGVSAPDLTITAAHAPSLFSPGKLMTYTVTYSNTGHSPAEDVIITTTLPQNSTYAGYGWTTSGGQTYTYEVDDLLAGAIEQAYFVVRYNDQSQIDVAEFNTPFVISESGIRGDANLDNNASHVYIGVPDLVVTDFTFEPSPLHPGQPVTFTVVVKNQGTGDAWNPDNGGGFWVDIFIASVSSYPFERDGDLWEDITFIEPGLQHTVVITHNGFSEQEIGEETDMFYVKVDNHGFYPYGLVPERDEMNNLFNPWSYYTYLPLVFR